MNQAKFFKAEPGEYNFNEIVGFKNATKKLLLSENPEKVLDILDGINDDLSDIASQLKENQHLPSIDAEIIIDDEDNLYDVRLFDAYQQIKLEPINYRNSDGWSHWLLESGIEDKE